MQHLATFDSMMTHVADPRNAPETLVLRESIRAWRFYDHFRTDVDAPARSAQIGTRTPILDNLGADLAAAIETIQEIGDVDKLAAAVADAFPQSELSITKCCRTIHVVNETARAAQAAGSRAAFRRDVAISALDRCASDTPAAGLDGLE